MSFAHSIIGLSAKLVMTAAPSGQGHPLSILIFHRVLPQVDPMFPLEAHAPWFDAAMGIVARAFRVLRLSDAVRHLKEGSLPARALCITFDDGYADNHDVALPILQRHGLTACFFVATGFLGGGRMFNDTVIESIRQSPLPSLDLSGFGLGEVRIGSLQQRAAAIVAMLPKIKYLRPQERVRALADLQTICRPTHLPDDLMMDGAQIVALHRAGMEIGAHTVSHPILASLASGEAERELRDSRDQLESMIQAPVPLLAYPNGKPGQDYLSSHAQMARSLGFSAAVTTAPGVARRGDDLFQLPRYTPWKPGARTWVAQLVSRRWQRDYPVA